MRKRKSGVSMDDAKGVKHSADCERTQFIKELKTLKQRTSELRCQVHSARTHIVTHTHAYAHPHTHDINAVDVLPLSPTGSLAFAVSVSLFVCLPVCLPPSFLPMSILFRSSLLFIVLNSIQSLFSINSSHLNISVLLVPFDRWRSVVGPMMLHRQHHASFGLYRNAASIALVILGPRYLYCLTMDIV